MISALFLAFFTFLLGIAEGYFVFKKDWLDRKKPYQIVLWIFGFAFLVWLGIILRTLINNQSNYLSAITLTNLVGGFLTGMGVYLIYYLCRRLKSFKNIFLLACVGMAGAIAMFFLGILIISQFE